MSEEKDKLPLDARLLSEAIIELNISRRNVAIYPKGHPSVEKALEKAFELLGKLFELRTDITLAVAKDTLIIDNYFLDKKNPVYREFALHLNAINIAFVKFINGLTKDELYILHSLLSENIKNILLPEIQEKINQSGLVHIKVGFIDFGAFTFAEGETKTENTADEHLWERYVYGLLEGTLETDDIDRIVNQIPPEKLAWLLNKGTVADIKEEAYDRVITKYLRKSSERAFTGSELKRLMDFINKLRPELKSQFLSSACKDISQDIDSAEKALKEVSVDKIIEMLDTINNQKLAIPDTLKNLLNKFSRLDADFGSNITFSGNLVSDDILISPDIMSLLGEGHYESFVTDTYYKEIQKLVNFKSVETETGKIEKYRKELSDEYIDNEFNAAVLELINSDFVSEEEYLYFTETLLKELAIEFTGNGQYSQVMKIFKVLSSNLKCNKFPVITGNAIDFFNSDEFVTLVIDSLRIIGRQVKDDSLLFCDYYGERLIPILIEALIDEELQSTRRFLISTIKHFGYKAVPEVLKRLRDERWYVRRNMIFILTELGGDDVVPHIKPFCKDKNPKVSFEAIKYLLKVRDSSGIEGLKEYLKAESPDLVEKGINLSASYKVREVLPELIQMLKKTNAVSADFYEKIPIVRALGQIGDTSALDAIKGLLSAKSLLFKSAVENLKEEIYKTLKHYPYEEIKVLLEAGIKSKNDVIRRESLNLWR